MSSKPADKETKVADEKAATTTTTTSAAVPTPQVREIQYVVNRPLSAGESPDIIPARIKRQVGDDPNILDLIVAGPDGKDAEVLNVRRSNRQEPGTWFEGEK
jgi:hypothetical protein